MADSPERPLCVCTCVRVEARSSAGAVSATLDAVKDLLLQLPALLLLLRDALGLGRGSAGAVAVQDLAVLRLPQIGIKAAWYVQERAVVSPLSYLALKR